MSGLVVWKYHLESGSVTDTKLHPGAKPIHAGVDPQGQTSLWVLLDPDPPRPFTPEHRVFLTLMTGQVWPLDYPLIHVQSFAAFEWIFHVFEVQTDEFFPKERPLAALSNQGPSQGPDLAGHWTTPTQVG